MTRVSSAGVRVTSTELVWVPLLAVNVTTVGRLSAGLGCGVASLTPAQRGSEMLGLFVVPLVIVAAGPLLTTVEKVVALVEPLPSITVGRSRSVVIAATATFAVGVAVGGTVPPVPPHGLGSQTGGAFGPTGGAVVPAGEALPSVITT